MSSTYIVPKVSGQVIDDVNNRLTNKIVDVKRFGPLSESASVVISGSGEVDFSVSTTATSMSVGSLKKEPGRIYVEGRALKNNGYTQYLNGVNIPWNRWNEFGSTSNYGYDHTWWDAEFRRLVDRGINAVRIWLVCNAQNEGIVIDSNGMCLAPTTRFWNDVDDLMALASTYKIFVMPTLFSFDNFSWNTPGSENWHKMLGSAAGIQSLIDNYIVPLAERYKDNQWLWAIDLCNEMDWLQEKSDLATPYGGTCRPVGNGSTVVNFGQRVPDFVVGQHMYCISSSGVSYDMGLVIERNNDIQVTCTNGFMSASETLIAGSASGKWMFTGFTWRTIRRYLAMSSAAIHSRSRALVTFGMGTIKYASSVYGSDNYADSLLIAETGNGLSVLDLHQIHWYSWAEPWFRLLMSPVAHGLSAKPAIMGEFPCRWEDMNIPSVTGWCPQHWYNYGQIICKSEGNNINFYRCTTIGGGDSGLDLGPTGQDVYNDIPDGSISWRYLPHGSWQGDKAYNVYDMVICDINAWDPSYPPENGYTATPGRLYMCTVAGTSDQNGSGPSGRGTVITDGTATWTYVREAVVEKSIGGTLYNENTAYEFFIANGWYGHFPWSGNSVDSNGGLYKTHLSGQYLIGWQPLTDYYVNNEVLNDDNKLYRCIVQGKSSSTGPTGISDDIVDGEVHWKYVGDFSELWTSAGMAVKSFSTTHSSAVYPDTSGVWINNGKVIRQSKDRSWYMTGCDMRAIISFSFGDGEDNLIQRVGLFDSADGLFLQMSGSAGLSLCVRSNSIDTEYQQSSWDDPLNGTGHSRITIDFTRLQTLVIDFGWIHGGKTRFGFVVNGSVAWAKDILLNNTSSVAYPSNPNLPIRWEISASNIISQIRSMKSYHGYIVSTAKLNGKLSGYNRNGASVGIGGGDTAEAMALRVTSTLSKFATFRPTRLAIVCTSGVDQYLFNWRIVVNPTYTGAGTYYSIPNGAIEVATNRNVDVGTGTILAQGFSRGGCEINLDNMQYVGADANDAADILSVQITNIPNNPNWYYVSLEWEEIK